MNATERTNELERLERELQRLLSECRQDTARDTRYPNPLYTLSKNQIKKRDQKIAGIERAIDALRAQEAK